MTTVLTTRRRLLLGALALATTLVGTTTTADAAVTIGATRAATHNDAMPMPATSGTPLIKQMRAGQVIATYTHLGGGPSGGAFVRTHTFNNRQPGDVFLVYPAVYEGPGQYPWIGPLANNGEDFAAGIFQKPSNIIIRGVTVNGVRPVIRLGTEGDYNVMGHGMIEIEEANGLTIENIDIDATDGDWVDRAGLYIIASRNVTLRNMRIHGFQDSQHNGIFAAGASSGTLLMSNLRLYDNGGWDGPSHNVYINASTSDPNYTARMINSYATAVNVGHLFKSRAQVTTLTGNLIEGIDAPADWDCAESYGVDVPEGGRLTVKNNIFIKGRAGECANGVLLRYAAEGADPGRVHSVNVQNNTFIARSTTYDAAGHANIPHLFFTPAVIPGASNGWPSGVTATIRYNRYQGFDNSEGGKAEQYRGRTFIDVPG